MIAPSVGIACFREQDVLLIRRGTAPLAGHWSIPGGRIEFGETAGAAALRELQEETSVTAELCGLVDVVDAIFSSRRSGDVSRHYLLCDYAARWTSGEPHGGDDAAHAVFVDPYNLGKMDLWSETRRIIEAARKLVHSAK